MPSASDVQLPLYFHKLHAGQDSEESDKVWDYSNACSKGEGRGPAYQGKRQKGAR